MDAEPLHPDWGPVKTGRHSEIGGGELCVNLAGVLQIMRTGGTPKATASYKAACRRWREVKDDTAMTEHEKQFECIRYAMAQHGTAITIQAAG